MVWEPTKGSSRAFFISSFHLVFCRICLSCLLFFLFFCCSVQPSKSSWDCMRLTCFCFVFLLSMCWWCIFCTRFLFTINHVCYLECFEIIVLAGFLSSDASHALDCLWLIVSKPWSFWSCVCCFSLT